MSESLINNAMPLIVGGLKFLKYLRTIMQKFSEEGFRFLKTLNYREQNPKRTKIEKFQITLIALLQNLTVP